MIDDCGYCILAAGVVVVEAQPGRRNPGSSLRAGRGVVVGMRGQLLVTMYGILYVSCE